MRFQVPQFIDTEDKIIGPFTLKQFLMYFTAIMVLIPVYLLSDMALFITVAIPVLSIAAAFAHYRLHGKSLFTIIANALSFFMSGQTYTWRRVADAKMLVIKDKVFEDWIVETGGMDREGLTSLSDIAQTLETEGRAIKDEDVVEDIFDEESPKATASNKDAIT